VTLDEFSLQAGEEALSHALSWASPTVPIEGANTHLTAALAEGKAGALVTVVDDVLWLALGQRHVERR
jgi:hypothetical protein